MFMFPSSIDCAHFAQARTITVEPEAQCGIPRPRLGFFGVIDERFDIELLDSVARTRADWQFVIIGPIVKIDPATLPRHKNIHYLGKKDYKDLPAYLAGWDVALLLFARNQSTRFISPTKTLEYLASGKPVVSTSINDVVHPYGQQGLVSIADAPDDFKQTVTEILLGENDSAHRLERIDKFLEGMSWDETWSRMAALIDQKILVNRASVCTTKTKGNEGIEHARCLTI
jgi:UDP-galactopyranose mutase